MLFGTMLSNIQKRPKSASTNLAIRSSQTHFIAGNVAFSACCGARSVKMPREASARLQR